MVTCTCTDAKSSLALIYFTTVDNNYLLLFSHSIYTSTIFITTATITDASLASAITVAFDITIGFVIAVAAAAISLVKLFNW